MCIADKKVVIIGAGIAGLAAAQALAKAGAEVTVLEQASEIREVGAGLQISPNGFAVIKALGLGEALRACSVPGQGVDLFDYRRGPVLHLDLGLLAPQEYFFVHRADLIEILAQGARAAGVRIRLLQRVTGVTHGDSPAVQVATGGQFTADLVIGADGLHSVLRPALNGPREPKFTGQVAWRAIVPNRAGRGADARVHMGPHRHVVSYPLRDRSLLNIVAVQERAAWSAESWSQEDDPAHLRAAFSDFGPEVQDMLGLVDTVMLWGLFRHPVAENWCGAGVAILGDAAHPTLPFLAQGASMGLEDAWVLAKSLSGSDTIQAGLTAYQALRRPRVCRVIDAATRNAWKYHLAFPPVRAVAHMGLRIGGRLFPTRMMRQFDWLYGHDVTAR